MVSGLIVLENKNRICKVICKMYVKKKKNVFCICVYKYMYVYAF